MKKTFLTANWKNLIMANYVIDPSLLEPYLPYKTELDQFNDKTYVSLVGFMFCNTRIKGIKVPFHVNFEEVNLRFYVKHHDNGIIKRGAVFIKEIVPKPAITFVANLLYKEKYFFMPMKNSHRLSTHDVRTNYQWKYKGAWNKLEVVAEKDAHVLVEGSEESFIAEHYWGYSRINDQITNEYAVEHPSWKVHTVKDYKIDCDFEKLYGSHFTFLSTALPNSIFMAQGSAVSVSNKKILQ